MKSSVLFNHEDKTEELLCGQDTKNLMQKQHMEGWKIEDYNAVQRQLKRRKLRMFKSVKAKQWGKSLAASEAVPDDHDKNSISTTGEKLNISVVT